MLVPRVYSEHQGILDTRSIGHEEPDRQRKPVKVIVFSVKLLTPLATDLIAELG
jgi:hypothetical protein